MLTPHRLPLGAGPPFCVVVVLVTGSGSRSCVGAGEGMRVGAAVISRKKVSAQLLACGVVARTQARIDASHVYEHLSKHRSKAKTERTGSNDQTGAPRASFQIRCSYDVKLHRPIRKHPRRAPGTAGAGGVRGDAPSPSAPVNRPAPSTRVARFPTTRTASQHRT